MARAARLVGVLPVLGALVTATALTGAALFTVSQAACADGGQYVQRGGQLELVGGCLTPEDLPGGVPQQEQRKRQDGAHGDVHVSP